ncbi:insulin-like growth factor-binding protein 7 [Boleophthalmus pectinirostris]|uniref:insulin-like growth factor-binding protein 7 n=1 Tax=Boleophthalmus pectinirostris TaxID=150288 RepID=UPI00243142C3|nr:insulin-like growth factor-binding protein 7 [Boleophthalmus pectinirostris]
MTAVRGLLLVALLVVVGSDPAPEVPKVPEAPVVPALPVIPAVPVETPVEPLLSGEGQPCARGAGPRCGAGLECVRADKKNKVGVCRCKSVHEVCGSDGVTYKTPCALKSANDRRDPELQPVTVKGKGRCPSAPRIVTPPGEVYNVSGSQVYLSCEAEGVPTPVLTWNKVVNGGRKRVELLPGDRDNLAVQTRGGPEKHEVTGWVLISPLTKAESGSYECHASNSQGSASAVGAIHLVQSLDDITVKRVLKDEEL